MTQAQGFFPGAPARKTVVAPTRPRAAGGEDGELTGVVGPKTRPKAAMVVDDRDGAGASDAGKQRGSTARRLGCGGSTVTAQFCYRSK